MLVALHADTGQRAEAHRLLPEATFRCPECSWPAVLKRGRVKVAHFAHQPGAPDCNSASESVTHMRAKLLLAARFRELGYEANLEQPHSDWQRRVDVSVTLADRRGVARQIAVEIQDSPIAVDEVRRRNDADRKAGYFATVWVFTSNRLHKLRAALPGYELRLPEETRYLINRWRVPVAVLDVNREQILLLSTAYATRDGQTWFDQDGDERSSSGRTLKATKRIATALAEFTLTALTGRYAKPGQPDYTAGFRPAPEPEHPWLVTILDPASRKSISSKHLQTYPTGIDAWSQVNQATDNGYDVHLTHTPTRRVWRRETKLGMSGEYRTWTLHLDPLPDR
jgi:hypothetical protein